MRVTTLSACLVLGLLCGVVGCAHKKPDMVTMAGGRVDGAVAAPVPQTTAAARAALLELKLQVVQYLTDASHGRVVAYTANNERIEIDVMPEDKGSHVALQTAGRAGEQLSALIMKRIREKI